MISDKLSNMARYKHLLPQLPQVEGFIHNHRNEENMPCRQYSIDGNEVFALVQEYITRESKEIKWEAHRNYIDVQFIFRGKESIGYAPLEELTLAEDYSGQNDIAFYNGPENFTSISLSEDMFVIFFPGEGHLPCCINEVATKVKKIVFKLKINTSQIND